jgi:hypothetical protein
MTSDEVTNTVTITAGATTNADAAGLLAFTMP